MIDCLILTPNQYIQVYFMPSGYEITFIERSYSYFCCSREFFTVIYQVPLTEMNNLCPSVWFQVFPFNINDL